jgi:hypothetical protein
MSVDSKYARRKLEYFILNHSITRGVACARHEDGEGSQWRGLLETWPPVFGWRLIAHADQNHRNGPYAWLAQHLGTQERRLDAR